MKHMNGSGGRVATRVITSVVAMLVALLLCEVVARSFFRSRWDTSALYAQADRINIKSLIDLDDDPNIFYRLRPNMDAEFQGSRVLTSPSGHRVGVAGSQPPGKAIRVALLGDSTPFGWRVDYSETYAELLRKRLEQHSGSPVVLENFSVPGYNASQEYAQLKSEVLAWSPDLVIVHHDHNDSQPTGWGYSSWVPPEYGENFLHSAALKTLLRLVRARLGPRAKESADAKDELVDGYCIAGPSYEAMIDSRRRLVEDATARGIPVLIVLFNADIKADDQYASSPTFLRLHEALRVRLEGMGCSVLDLLPCYQKWLKDHSLSDMSSLWVSPEDHHPNARGHALLADFIGQSIENSPKLSPKFSR